MDPLYDHKTSMPSRLSLHRLDSPNSNGWNLSFPNAICPPRERPANVQNVAVSLSRYKTQQVYTKATIGPKVTPIWAQSARSIAINDFPHCSQAAILQQKKQSWHTVSSKKAHLYQKAPVKCPSAPPFGIEANEVGPFGRPPLQRRRKIQAP